MRELAIMILRMLGADMEIVISDKFACQYSYLLDDGYKLHLPEDELNGLYNASLVTELIEEIYGVKIDNSEEGLATFVIAHEIGHYMELKEHKSNLARFGYILVHEHDYDSIDKESDAIDELQAQYDEAKRAYEAESDKTRKLFNECMASMDINSMREVTNRKAKDTKRYNELRAMKQEIDRRNHNNEIAYRLVGKEVYADKWAIEFIKANFPELIVG